MKTTSGKILHGNKYYNKSCGITGISGSIHGDNPKISTKIQ
ncbi:hypothetical protein [Rickettsia endosymbiont of Cardiosporidium cionae]|nr:hypothetical protein [Rickettsia endosymbiont of Cardiosporidium cionae]